MSPDQLFQTTYNVALVCVLWATAIGVGLRISVREMIRSVTQVRLMTQGLILNLLIVPVIVWLLTRILPVEPALAIGLVLLAASAGGPYGLVVARLAGGDVVSALALISILQVARVVTIPLWLGLALPFALSDVVQVLAVLGLYLLLPLAIGGALRRVPGQRRAALERVSQVARNVFLVILITSGILLYRQPLAALVVSWAMLLFVSIQTLSLILGYLLGRPTEAGQRMLAVTAVVRSSATALLLATQVYGGQPLVAATVIVYGLTAVIVSTLAAIALERRYPKLESVAA